MPQLQQILSRIQSGELTRENDRVGQQGFYDFIEKDNNILHDIDYCSDTFWDLYETMASTKTLEKEYRWNKITGELLGTFHSDKPMGDDETNVKPVKGLTPMNNEEKYKNLILSLAYSATLCDHMGDMWSDIIKVLEDIGEEELANADRDYEDEEDESEFSMIMRSRGIKTVWGTE